MMLKGFGAKKTARIPTAMMKYMYGLKLSGGTLRNVMTVVLTVTMATTEISTIRIRLK
jgi:hypothetical protein